MNTVANLGAQTCSQALAQLFVAFNAEKQEAQRNKKIQNEKAKFHVLYKFNT